MGRNRPEFSARTDHEARSGVDLHHDELLVDDEHRLAGVVEELAKLLGALVFDALGAAPCAGPDEQRGRRNGYQ
jgi:hypothetical protein